MLSGNGRHRRPRQAPALVVAAGVTGSALAIPLLGATSAHAVEGAVWDRLAECESGGVWSANMDNGYYGGLQLTQATWEQHGGLDYAPRPDLASRSQQIAVAEKILDELGPDAWPTCAPVSGIDEGEPNPIETLLPTEPTEPTEPTDPTGTPDDPSATPSDDATATPSDDTENPDNTDNGGEGDNSEASPEPSPSEPTEPSESTEPSDSTEPSEPSEGSGRHRGDPAPEAPDSDRDGGSGRHADRGGSGRDGGNYTVRAGDSLWSIAESRDVDGGWAALYGANEEVVGGDPDLIVPGQVLDLGGK